MTINNCQMGQLLLDLYTDLDRSIRANRRLANAICRIGVALVQGGDNGEVEETPPPTPQAARSLPVAADAQSTTLPPRKPKALAKDIVADYLADHPDATGREIVNATGLSDSTVYGVLRAMKHQQPEPEVEAEIEPANDQADNDQDEAEIDDDSEVEPDDEDSDDDDSVLVDDDEEETDEDDDFEPESDEDSDDEPAKPAPTSIRERLIREYLNSAPDTTPGEIAEIFGCDLALAERVVMLVTDG